MKRRNPTWAGLVLGLALACPAIAAEPLPKNGKGLELVGPVSVGVNMVVLPDGTWEAYKAVNPGKGFKLTRIRSTDEGRTWSKPETVHDLHGDDWDLPEEPWTGCVALLDNAGEVHLFFMRLRLEGAARTVAVDRCIDIWHLKSLEKRTKWSASQRIFKGYTGSIQGALQLRSGRIVFPIGSWVAGREAAPPTGAHFCTTIYSDDAGKTWKQSPAQLTSPCNANYNGNNYGACEPVAVERTDGEVWMLMRTQAGFLYESFSKDGADWSEAKPSRFHSSDSPAALAKLADGRLVVAWNNCENPPRVGDQGVYGGRDALHAAISDDCGKTWRGYRELYLDAKRHDSPPVLGDRGTAYPCLVAAKNGRVGVISGQGAGRRSLTFMDPRWLLETSRDEDFSEGLEGWSAFTAFGPVKRYWRDRTLGARLIDHPDKPGAKVLHLRRADDKAGDGAVWNFPVGTVGKLSMRVRLEKDFGGGSIALGDHFFDPTDDTGEEQALFALPISAEGKLGDGPKLDSARWYALGLDWNTTERKCRVHLDGKEVVTLTQGKQTEAGTCYLRLRSTAKAKDSAGFLVEKVAVRVAE